ncbi:MAG: bifunctional riboflavin kinase/FAD synthetase [Gammaproteobacteria bacterium]|nr:bifunctional riboflavin kinase/FAD synthetase [Gammaproteobacteria bacterium]MDH4253369.1 bifunctional riboflavin kinase/FAD synthetase [Gammaproteobacteria bacterium]MDH5310143.1 bifunctional riboflavin kinase/FAD synthetase [Gammaproteobacteria bacterium]
MRLARTTRSFPYRQVEPGTIVTIGAFDGLHLGHQRLLRHVFAEAERRHLPTAVMSFEPMPKEYFSAARPPARLMRFREKYDALRAAGVDIFFCPRFGETMKNIGADTFIRRLLVHTLNVRHLVIGDDFQFARNREGGLQHLQRAARALDFTIEQVPSVVVGGERVSSTSVREALWQGDLERATRLLGRPYRMSGKVIGGQKLGHELGYPTANVNLQRRQSAVMGIFAVRVHGLADGPLDAVASVGTRPTFEGIKPLLEVHIFDFDEDIYGRYIHVDFIARLRNELKFDSVDALVEQMHKDSAEARAILAA